jgi:hypothetical protein
MPVKRATEGRCSRSRQRRGSRIAGVDRTGVTRGDAVGAQQAGLTARAMGVLSTETARRRTEKREHAGERNGADHRSHVVDRSAIPDDAARFAGAAVTERLRLRARAARTRADHGGPVSLIR